jgi:nitroimidazol reductase NimA-like FMN-containing flavoprotein (pyridoxamine 5'-phosphate oxidase superfamily)
MLKIKEMSEDEKLALLARVGYGHLGCARDDHPYVVPMNFAFDSQDLYFFTTEGTKTEYMSANHEVCFQVEDVKDAGHWQSVMLMGRAERVTKDDEMERAMRLITGRNPSLTPAINRTSIGAWKRPSNIVIYRVRPNAIYGRQTAPDESSSETISI